MRRGAVLVAIVVLLTASPVRAGRDSFRSSGRCTHVSAALLVDAGAASELVADDFVLLEPVPGRATLALVTQDCMTSVDDGVATRAVNSVVFVFVDPVRSPSGCQIYDLFWTNSRNDDWHRAMQDIGMAEALSPRTTLSVEPGPLGAAVAASNPYPPAPFAYSGTAALDALAPPGPLTSMHCHEGERGLIRQTYDHQISTGAVAADVTFGRSALWDRLGASGTTTAGLFAHFTWTGLTELVSHD